MIRSRAAVQTLPVTLIPGSGQVHMDLLVCDRCGRVPLDMSQGRMSLQLNRVGFPEGPILFLGPTCTEAVIAEWLAS